MLPGVGEAELHLARRDLADFLHARALSHCQRAISSFTRYVLCHSALMFYLPRLYFTLSVDLTAKRSYTIGKKCNVVVVVVCI